MAATPAYMEHNAVRCAQRTWFPEMLDVLRVRSRAKLSFGEMIALREELDAMLHRIRSERCNRTPVNQVPSVRPLWSRRGA